MCRRYVDCKDDDKDVVNDKQDSVELTDMIPSLMDPYADIRLTASTSEKRITLNNPSYRDFTEFQNADSDVEKPPDSLPLKKFRSSFLDRTSRSTSDTIRSNSKVAPDRNYYINW